MNAHEQYLSLFAHNEAEVCRHCPEPMNERRFPARRALAEQGFPAADDPDWRYTDPQALFAHDYGLNLRPCTGRFDPDGPFRCDIPNLSLSPFFLVNDTFFRSPDPPKLPQGVFAGSLHDFCLRYPTLAERYYGQAAAPDDNGVVALNTLFVQDGFVLYLPRHTRLDRPIQLINVSRSRVDLLANRRILVILEAGAEARLLVCGHDEGHDSHRFLTTQVVEMFVEEGAHAEYYDLEESAESTCRLSHFYLSQAADSDVLINAVTLRNGHTRNDFRATLGGEGARLTLSALAILDDARRMDTHTRVIHATPRSRSQELVKNVLRGDSLAVFHGHILVSPGAEKTQAEQINRNLCLSPEARVFSRPQLEIYADDVHCSHGMSTGQLDEAALFYMKSRGIPYHEAFLLLSIAFTDDVLETICIEFLKNRLRHLVEKRFRGETAHCASCRLDNAGAK